MTDTINNDANLLKRIDHYQLISVLGQGGFGTVYLASDETGRKVALKVAPKDLASRVEERFSNEIQVSRRVGHQNIRKALEKGQTKDFEYIAYEYVEGKTIADILFERHTLSVNETLLVLEGVVSGLTALHDNGILHRDIKPSNVILQNGEIRAGAVKLMDLGVYGELEQDTNTTQIGQVYGTPTYMAPEQLMGRAQTTATDIYATGLLGFEMLYGRRPFSASSTFELISQKLEGLIRFPDDPSIPPAVQILLQSCLAVDAVKRPASAHAVLDAIRNIKNSSSPPDPVYSRPRKVPWAAIVLSAVVLCFVGLAFSFKGTPRLAFAGIAVAIGLSGFGLLASRSFSRWAGHKAAQGGQKAARLLTDAKERSQLSQTIALEIDGLLESCRRIDDRILVATLAEMISEYQVAKTSPDRQSALMNSVAMLDKLSTRLSPWYVRQEKLLAFVLSFLSIASGAASIVVSVIKILKVGHE